MPSDPIGSVARPFIGGRLLLAQPETGHRAGTDAVLLAASGPPDFDGLAVDLGAGTGAAGLAFATLAPRASVTLVEIDEGLANLARENIARNGLGGRASVARVDLTAPRREREAAGLASGTAGLVLANPPFLDPARARLSPDPLRRQAHAMPEGGLAAWIGTAVDLLAPGGACVVIHRADALADLLSSMSGRFGGLSVLPVHARADEAAVRVLVRGRKGSRAPLSLRPGLVLHAADGRFTAQSEALHRGEAVIDWGDQRQARAPDSTP
jgi:tRNA1(Val) A37 N6-methylase TrmN6